MPDNLMAALKRRQAALNELAPAPPPPPPVLPDRVGLDKAAGITSRRTEDIDLDETPAGEQLRRIALLTKMKGGK